MTLLLWCGKEERQAELHRKIRLSAMKEVEGVGFWTVLRGRSRGWTAGLANGVYLGLKGKEKALWGI